MPSILWSAVADFNRYLVFGTAILVVIAVYFVSHVIYNLFFSPIAGFPGPKLAAATGWVEFYHDYFRQGRYIYEIEKMHQKYGKRIPNCVAARKAKSNVYSQARSFGLTQKSSLFTIRRFITRYIALKARDGRIITTILAKELILMVCTDLGATSAAWKIISYMFLYRFSFSHHTP